MRWLRGCSASISAGDSRRCGVVTGGVIDVASALSVSLSSSGEWTVRVVVRPSGKLAVSSRSSPRADTSNVIQRSKSGMVAKSSQTCAKAVVQRSDSTAVVVTRGAERGHDAKPLLARAIADEKRLLTKRQPAARLRT